MFTEKQLQEMYSQIENEDIDKNSDIQLVYQSEHERNADYSNARCVGYTSVVEFKGKYYQILSAVTKFKSSNSWEHSSPREVARRERTETVVWYE